MPQPNASQVHIDQPLAIMSVGYQQKMTNFVADAVFPNIPSDKQSNLYFKYNRGDFFRDDYELRAPGTPAAAAGYKLATGNYFCNVYALRRNIDDQIRNNEDVPLSSDRDAVRFLTQKGLIKRDVLWSTANFNTGVWGTDVTGVASAPSGGQFLQWDQSGSDPTSNILDGHATIMEATGYEANCLILQYRVKRRLKTNASIIDRLKYGQTAGGIVTVKDSDLAQLFEVDKVLTAGAVKTTSAESEALDSDTDGSTYSFILGKNAFLGYANPSPGINEASAGYTFSWTGQLGATTPSGIKLKKYRWEEDSADRVEGEMAVDFRVVSKFLGYFFSAAVAS